MKSCLLNDDERATPKLACKPGGNPSGCERRTTPGKAELLPPWLKVSTTIKILKVPDSCMSEVISSMELDLFIKDLEKWRRQAVPKKIQFIVCVHNGTLPAVAAIVFCKTIAASGTKI